MDNNYNQLLTIVSIAKQIDGRKKFQKIAFILKSKGAPLAERFKYHYYGPYSSDLQLEIDDLVDYKYLDEDNSTGSYLYKIKKNEFEKDTQVEKMKDLIVLLNNQETKLLELTSTIYFLEQEGYTDNNIIKKKLISLKPHLEGYISPSFGLKEQIDSFA